MTPVRPTLNSISIKFCNDFFCREFISNCPARTFCRYLSFLAALRIDFNDNPINFIREIRSFFCPFCDIFNNFFNVCKFLRSLLVFKPSHQVVQSFTMVRNLQGRDHQYYIKIHLNFVMQQFSDPVGAMILQQRFVDWQIVLPHFFPALYLMLQMIFSA